MISATNILVSSVSKSYTWYDMIWYDMIWYDMIYDLWYMIYDIWFMIYDIWYMIDDLWYIIYDICCMIFDIWFMIYDMYLSRNWSFIPSSPTWGALLESRGRQWLDQLLVSLWPLWVMQPPKTRSRVKKQRKVSTIQSNYLKKMGKTKFNSNFCTCTYPNPPFFCSNSHLPRLPKLLPPNKTNTISQKNSPPLPIFSTINIFP